MELLLYTAVGIALCLSVFEAIVILALARQIGALSVTIEGRHESFEGLPLGSQLPEFEATLLDGTPASTTLVRDDRKAALLFVTSGCGTCSEVLDQLNNLSERWREKGGLVMVVGDPDGEVTRPDWPVDDGLRVLQQHDYSGQLAVRAPQLPWAVVVDERGMVIDQGRIEDGSSLEKLLT